MPDAGGGGPAGLGEGQDDDAARADGDESLEVGWFERPALPDLDGWSRLRLGTPDGWFAAAGAPPHPGLSDPYAL